MRLAGGVCGQPLFTCHQFLPAVHHYRFVHQGLQRIRAVLTTTGKCADSFPFNTHLEGLLVHGTPSVQPLAHLPGTQFFDTRAIPVNRHRVSDGVHLHWTAGFESLLVPPVPAAVSQSSSDGKFDYRLSSEFISPSLTKTLLCLPAIRPHHQEDDSLVGVYSSANVVPHLPQGCER
jgi:hypothetical protein